MTIYILRAFCSDYKNPNEAFIVGYYTSKGALWHAIRKHSDSLKIYDTKRVQHYLARGEFDTVGIYMDRGTVEAVTTNTEYDSFFCD